MVVIVVIIIVCHVYVGVQGKNDSNIKSAK